MNATFELASDEKGRLLLKRPGEPEALDVRIRQAFPLTQPTCHISIRNGEGKELMLIDDLSGIDAVNRRIIEQSLVGTSFVPRILRIEEVDVRFGYQQWSVQTDRGPISFRVQEREDIRFLPDGRYRIKDADGNIYELGAIDQLDEQSRKAVEALL